jgi:hypothetical protein
MFAFIGYGKAMFLANNGKRYIPGKLSDMASQYVNWLALIAQTLAIYTDIKEKNYGLKSFVH